MHLPKKDVVFFIPGNPGSIAPYHSFVQRMSEVCEGHGDSFGAYSYAGHEKEDCDKFDHLITLKEQIDHLSSAIGELHSKLDADVDASQQRTIHFVAHSLGAYLLIQSLHQNPQFLNQRSKVILVFPMLCHFRDKCGAIVKLLTTGFMINWAPWLFANIPGIKSLGLLLYGKRGVDAERFVNELTVRNLLFTAADEYSTIGIPDVSALETVVEKVNSFQMIYSSKSDNWAPKSDVTLFQSIFEGFGSHGNNVSIMTEDVGIRHAFVFEKRSVVELCKILSVSLFGEH